MTSNQLKIVGGIVIGYGLYRKFSKKNITNKEDAIAQSITLIGVGIIIYAMMK